jgi:hypothetical protein
MIIRSCYDMPEYWQASWVRKYMKDLPCGSHRAWNGLVEEPDCKIVYRLLNAPDKCKLLHSASDARERHELLQLENHAIASVTLSPGKLEIFLAGMEQNLLDKLLDTVAEYAISLRGKADEKVGITFSYMTPHGAGYYNRNIECPKWNEVRENYTNAPQIEWLLNLDRPLDYGKLIFWYGKPGTGKTYCIRLLMREWKDKANFIYVLDPEQLFGKAGYLIDSLLHEPEESRPKKEAKEKSRLKVLIIEDALDFLLEENRKDMSAAMSRLLNLTEGIVGQGFKVLVLITSNEQVGQIDPAFIRAGRCLQMLEFLPFTVRSGKYWLEVHGKNCALDGEKTLADLYAMLKPAGLQRVITKGTPGFRPALA